jgi:thiol-disulfide isomerase/thioredoxin
MPYRLVLLLFFLAAKIYAPAQGMRNTVFPSLRIQLLDSNSVFNTTFVKKDKPVVFLVFNTNCEHCQQEAGDLVKKKNLLHNIRIVMFSHENITTIKNFSKKYALSQLPDLVIGRDYLFDSRNYFSYESVPFCAIYTKKHSFLKYFERDFKTEDIIGVLREHKEL